MGSVPATAHDGHTLQVCTAHGSWRNDANGDDNSDGESINRNSGGVEGATDDEVVNARRDRQRDNAQGTLLLSAGGPTILGGDRLGGSQGGTNGAHHEDDEISWFDHPWCTPACSRNLRQG